MTYPATPNLDKMVEVSEESNKIGAFLNWLMHKRNPRLHICTEDEHTREDPDLTLELNGLTYCPTCAAESGEWDEDSIYVFRPAIHGDSGINHILAEYYGIDYDEMDRERKKVLEYVREQNER